MRWIWWLFIPLLGACSTSKPSKTPKGLLGSNFEAFKATAGLPEKSLGNLHIYTNQGLLVYTNPNNTAIVGLVATWFQGGHRFSDKLAGLALGDTWPFCLSLLGEPLQRVSAGPDFDEALWEMNNQRIRLEIWTQDGHDPDLGGDYLAETIKRIQWSFIRLNLSDF